MPEQIVDFYNSRISGNAQVYGNARIFNNAQLAHTKQVLTIGPIGSENGVLTVIFREDGGIWCSRGCFEGTLAEFQAAVEKKPEGDANRSIYLSAIKFIQEISQFKKGNNHD